MCHLGFILTNQLYLVGNFPKAGVWPAAENGNNPGNPFMHLTDVSALPDYDTQVHLLELYWTYVRI